MALRFLLQRIPVPRVQAFKQRPVILRASGHEMLHACMAFGYAVDGEQLRFAEFAPGSARGAATDDATSCSSFAFRGHERDAA